MRKRRSRDAFDFMRILYISGDMGVEIGGRKGAATHVRETCHAFQRFGHEVRLITPAPGDRSQVRVPIIEVPAVRAKQLGHEGRYILLNRRMERVIDREIREFRPDAIYERYSLFQTAGLKLCRKYGIPRILEVNTLLAHEMRHRLKWPWLAGKAENRLWRKEPAIIAVSEMLKTLMVKQAGLKLEGMAGFVISPVAVDAPMFHPSTEPAAEVLQIAEGRSVAGYTGTLTAWHGVDLFFDAAAELKRLGANCLILAVGGEPERVERLRAEVLQKKLESHLRFHGSIPHHQVPHFLSAFTMCLIPDTQDWSSPTKFFEFAAMGKPIVASRSPSVDEVFGHNENAGFFFERGSGKAMAAQIVSCLNDPSEAARRGLVARQRILDHYTWEASIGRVMELYRAQGLAEAPVPPPYREALTTPGPLASL